ncbi:MAG: hypothetical protein V3S70_09060, partial [Gammaproteobacteria bacterium]
VQAIVCATMLSVFAFGCASTTAVPEPPDAGVQAEPASATETTSNEEDKGVLLSTYAAPKNKLICTREKRTGSRIPKRICMTTYEREVRREQDQRMLQDSQSSGMRAPAGL